MSQQSANSQIAQSGSVATTEAEEDQTNIKETIESILVAFILAFIFRAFVVEAFVIPTGSMAPTLLGAHMRFRCPDCGYVFDVNYSAPGSATDEDAPMPSDSFPVTDIYCPNCGFHVAGPREVGPTGDIRNPQDYVPVNYGDRILVLKYAYLLHPPQRWDVVVFKSPDEPQTYHYQQNFIKRLVGLPGEKLMVLAGNIYVWNDRDTKWEIPKKPRSAQDALWRIVYDNDFHPQLKQRPLGPQFVQPWRPSGEGWDESKGRTIYFNNASGTGTLRFDPNANSTTQTLTDYLIYDTGAGQWRRPGAIGSVDDENANPVSDLKLAMQYTRTSGTGPLRLTLVKHVDVDHTFTAEITPDAVTLTHRLSTGEITHWQKRLSELGITPNQSIYIDFENVDYGVTLRLNGKDAFQRMDYDPNVDWLKDQYFNHPRDRGRPGEAFIEADQQKCTLDHLGLWRDVYYTNRGNQLHTGMPENPVQLAQGEFFVMGDNSAISKDARYWDQPIVLPHEGLDMPEGRVPEQFMLGKAVFVYWPAGYRLTDAVHVSVIPNFGDMRWIH